MSDISNKRIIQKHLIITSVTYNNDEYVVGIKINNTKNRPEYVTGIVYCNKYLYEHKTFNSIKKANTDIIKRIKLKLNNKVVKAS